MHYSPGSPKFVLLHVTCLLLLVAWRTGAKAADSPEQAPAPAALPEGFTSLIVGTDLAGWRGLGHVNPMEIAKWSDAERSGRQAAATEDMRSHWRVEGDEIVNDGQGAFLTTEKDYGDFELLIDWRMMSRNADSGIYLRGCPQVQIWDPDNEQQKANGADKGSGGLWNNNAPAGRYPIVRADSPAGEWNTFRIRMVGPRVTVWLNGKLVVDNAVMENFWDRQQPIFARGPIQIQTHGGEMRFRRIFIREIGPTAAEGR